MFKVKIIGVQCLSWEPLQIKNNDSKLKVAGKEMCTLFDCYQYCNKIVY